MTKPVVEMANLAKRFGTLTAVDDLSLTVNEGEILGFLGPNGAGKTTTIQMLCGLLKPDSGTVHLFGKEIGSDGRSSRLKIGLCSQEIMYALTTAQAETRAAALLADLGLSEKRRTLAKHLSGGMQRRLHLALALVHDPPLLFLDEPEAGLDPQGRILVREYIRTLSRNKTIILTTHNMDEADRLASRVAILDHGRLLRLDTPQQLKHSVGSGDLVEVALSRSPEEPAALLGTLPGEARFEPATQTLTIRMLDGVARMPAILKSLEEAGLPIHEVRVRETTLEDVFIHLTGRRLEE
jgi:ABC-2 type transport system ATP-binding protein